MYVFAGELYDKARDAVKAEGYTFKKGYSRSNSSSTSSDTDSVSPKVKKHNQNKEERKREIDNLSPMLDNVKSHLTIKQKRLEKAKSVSDYKLCDQLTLDVRQLLKEKNDLEGQMSAIQRKEVKSVWYYKGKGKSKKIQNLKRMSKGP